MQIMIEPMTSAELEQIREAAEGATPGPWSYEYCPYPDEQGFRIGNHEYVLGRRLWKENAAFIAISRTAVPRLLTEVARLTAALEAEKMRAEAILDAAAKCLGAKDTCFCTHYPAYVCDKDWPRECQQCVREWLDALTKGAAHDDT